MGGWRESMIVLRSLLRSPGFATLATLTLALGIGASAVVFAIADRALLRPLPFPESDRLVSVFEGWGSSLGSLEILQREMETVEAIGGAWDAVGTTFQPADGPARRVSVARVSPEYLEALGLQPAIGRLFRAEEAQARPDFNPERAAALLAQAGYAKGFDVTGWVRNLADGRVEMNIMGDEEELDEFLAELHDSPLGHHIQEQEERSVPLLEGVRGFTIESSE